MTGCNCVWEGSSDIDGVGNSDIKCGTRGKDKVEDKVEDNVEDNVDAMDGLSSRETIGRSWARCS